MKILYILTVSVSVLWFWYCSVVLQDVIIRGNHMGIYSYLKIKVYWKKQWNWGGVGETPLYVATQKNAYDITWSDRSRWQTFLFQSDDNSGISRLVGGKRLWKATYVGSEDWSQPVIYRSVCLNIGLLQSFLVLQWETDEEEGGCSVGCWVWGGSVHYAWNYG